MTNGWMPTDRYDDTDFGGRNYGRRDHGPGSVSPGQQPPRRRQQPGYQRDGYPPPGQQPPGQQPPPIQRPPRRPADPGAAARRRRSRVILALAAVFAVLIAAAAGFMFYKSHQTPPAAADFTGPAGAPAIVEVKPGDDASAIAEVMAEKGVTASAAAFYEAAVKVEAMNNLQPGFFSIPTHIPAAQAVTAMTDETNRVGHAILSEGRQLLDTKDVNTGSTREGIYRKLAAASCIGPAGQQKCVSYDDLVKAGSADPATLGVPAWALDAVRKVPDRTRQLEGLIAAGSVDFDPTSGPTEILRHLVATSADSYDKTGIETAGKAVNLSPYELLTAASLVQRESLPDDFPKVARVVLNRLAVNQPLQFDSTVNYALDETEVATTDADREKVTPWNTYAKPGLPATPISSPSIEALRAVENPAVGNWLYFVTVDKQGTTLFTADYNEHLDNIEKAKESGILDQGRAEPPR